MMKSYAFFILFATTMVSTVDKISWKGDFREPVIVSSPADPESILNIIFKKYLKSPDECPDNPGEIDEAFTNGFFVPRISNMYQGSFTNSKIQEILYVIFVGECGASESDHFGSRRLVLFQNDKIVMNEKFFWDQADHFVDVDGNGLLDLQTSSIYCGQGACEKEAALINIENNKINPLIDLGVVREENCDFLNKTGTTKSALVEVKDGVLKKRFLTYSCF